MWSVYVNFIVIITLLQVLYYMKISHNWLSVAFHMSVFPCRFETHRHTHSHADDRSTTILSLSL